MKQTPVNIVALAKKLKVSVSTVSRALNPETEKLISEKVRNRIKAFAKKAHYIPNRSARELVTGRTKTIGILLVTSFEALYFADHSHKFLEGLYKEMEDHPDYTCKIVMHAKGGILSEADQRILSTHVDGLLILSLVDHLAEEIRTLINKNLSRWGRPVVALNLEPHKPVQASLVYFSNYDAARLAVTHLIKTGHKNIGLIYGSNQFEGMQDRFRAFQETLRDHGMAVDPTAIRQGHFHSEGAYQATLELLKENKSKVSAIFCTTDQMAAGCLQALKSLGIRSPQDIAVMGFDGLAMGEFLNPRLSTVYPPTFEVAQAGTKLLIDQIEGLVKRPQNQVIPSQLIIRDSA